MSENRGSTMLEVTLAFFVGGLIGAGIALLYAPAAGVETRKKVRETTDKIRGRMREGYEAAIEKAEEEAGVAKEFIGEKVSEVKAAYSAGKDAYIKEKEKYAQKAS
ncbi:MAG: YtxH domain-containing protein [Nitrospirota bacterium]